MGSRLFGVSLAAAAMLGAGQVGADVYTFSYTGEGFSASGTFTTSNVLSTGSDGRQGYLLTGISGTRNGVAIDGLRDAAAFGFPLDNRIYPTGALVNYDGVGYGTGSGAYNLWSNGIQYVEITAPSTSGFGVSSFTATRVAGPGAPAPTLGVGLLSALAAGVALLATRRRAPRSRALATAV